MQVYACTHMHAYLRAHTEYRGLAETRTTLCRQPSISRRDLQMCESVFAHWLHSRTCTHLCQNISGDSCFTDQMALTMAVLLFERKDWQNRAIFSTRPILTHAPRTEQRLSDWSFVSPFANSEQCSSSRRVCLMELFIWVPSRFSDWDFRDFLIYLFHEKHNSV